MILFADTPGAVAAERAMRIELPAGLIGLKHLTSFEVEPIAGSWPFANLRAVGDDEPWNFIVLEPGNAIPGYEVELTDEDTDALELSRSEDALVLNIVTIHSDSPQYATANLMGPIVVNRHTGIGRQVIVANSDQYSTHYVLADERHVECAA